MKRIILVLALGLITLGLKAQIKVYIGHTPRGIVNQVYQSNYSIHNNRPFYHNRGHHRTHNYIWVEGYWKWSRTYQDYFWVEGRWIRKSQGRTYVAGSYKLINGIRIWVSGFWR